MLRGKNGVRAPEFVRRSRALRRRAFERDPQGEARTVLPAELPHLVEFLPDADQRISAADANGMRGRDRGNADWDRWGCRR